jgi:dihydrodipicolinate synthase/N-acetylneuraminate lyase
MTQTTVDPNEEVFVQRALAAASRAQQWDRARVIVTTVFAIIAAFWLASRPSSSELGMECTILIVVGAMLGVVTAKLRSLINRNTRTVLQAIAELRRSSE